MVDITGQTPPAEPKKGLFGGKVPAPVSPGPSMVEEDMNKLAARLKISEERYNELRRKILLIEQNMINNHKKSMNEIKVLNSEITDLNSKITEVQDRILLIIKELKLTAKKEDIDVMKKYVELWNPMRFVTKDQVEKIVKELMNGSEEAEKGTEE